MNSKSDVEKDLLQQITFLTRLIEQTSNSCKRNVQNASGIPNRNLLKSLGNLKNKGNIAKDNANKSLIKSSTSVLQECNSGILTYTKLKVLNKKINDPQKVMINKTRKLEIMKVEGDETSESSNSLIVNPVNICKNNVDVKVDVKDLIKCSPSKSDVTPFVELNKKMHELEKLKRNKIKGVANVKIEDNKTTLSPDNSINIAVKKSIHVNRKVLFENVKSENNQQSRNHCVHLNPAKLQLKSYKDQTKESGTSDLGKLTLECAQDDKKLCNYVSDKVPVSVRKVVHINPKFDKNSVIKQKVEMFAFKPDNSSIDSLKSNRSDTTSSSKICVNPVAKIHVNKNFISKSTVLDEFSKSVNNKTSTNFEAQNLKNVNLVTKNQNNLSSPDLNTKDILTPGGSNSTKLQGSTKVKSSALPSDKKNSDSQTNKCCETSVNKRLINCKPTAYHYNSLNLSKHKSQPKEFKNKGIIFKQGQNPVTKKFLIQRNTSSLTMHKYKNRNKVMIVNKNNPTILNRQLSNLQNINNPTCSSYVTNCISKNYKLVNKVKQIQPRSQPILKLSNSNSKLMKLVRLSKTKLVRAKSNFLPTTSKNNVRTTGTKVKNQNLLNIKRNKRVWIAPNKNIETNLQKKKIKTTTINPSPYKYNSVSNSNKLKYVKVNIPVKTSSRKILNSPKSEKNLGNISLNISKGKYGVQKQRTFIRRLSQTNLVSVSRTKLVRKSDHDIKASKNVFRCNNFSNSRTLSLNNKLTKVPAQIKVSPTLRTARSVKSKYKLIRNSNMNRAVYNWSCISRRNQKNNFNINLKTKLNIGISRNASRCRKRSLTIGGIKYHTTEMKLCRKFPVKEGKIFADRIFKNKGESYQVTRRGRCLKKINCSDIRHKLSVNNINRNNSRYRYNANQRLDFAHNKVAQAKQRSIALLTRKLRKSNELCLIFNRLGRCSGHERGVCNRLHDKKRVAICKKFLQGTCEKKECLLSHDVGPSKMPTCRHYLAGVCTRDDCPYLHVKVNSSAPICIQFLQGYCSDAEKCKKRHTAMCPEFEEKGVCCKGKSCPYPHPKLIKNHPKYIPAETVTIMEKFVPVENIKTEIDGNKSEEVSDNDLKTSRYYCAQEYVTGGEVTVSKRINDENLEDSLLASDWLRKRPKIGDLPGFIPLDADSSQS